MEPPPPPPPPHGASQQGGKAGGLPDGKYDIFVIPPSSAGSGFLYLPSLSTQRNSFLAGVACTAAAFFIWNITVPVVKSWLQETMTGGGSGVIILMLGVGVLSWAFGKTQAEGATPGGTSSGSASGASGSYSSQQQPPPHSGPSPQPHAGPQSPPKSSWQRPQANSSAGATGAKSTWEKAREETRKKEEEKKRAEDLKKKREELEKEKQKAREKELRERLERELKEKRARDEKNSAAAAAREAAEKTKQASPKRPPMPTARTEDDDDAYSFRPYDRPKHKANSAASMYSESSYAASQTTARTTPPPTQTRPYATKDPDKIIIRGVYSFNNAFMRTPISQLVSGQGSVTDGLILRITTEGLFIDDDRRGVPQREWDVKAWTMKLAEVWCPNIPVTVKSTPRKSTNPFAAAASRHDVAPSESDTAAFVSKFVQHCATKCKHLRPRRNTITPDDSASSAGTDETVLQSCEMAGLHVLRASIRDQEGKKYVFILSQSEGWKVAVGLQRLRRGTQVRALGVAGLPQNEAKALLQQLGYV